MQQVDHPMGGSRQAGETSEARETMAAVSSALAGGASQV
jgi:hypothetical protein